MFEVKNIYDKINVDYVYGWFKLSKYIIKNERTIINNYGYINAIHIVYKMDVIGAEKGSLLFFCASWQVGWGVHFAQMCKK